jgi:hypothetical protein
MEAAGLVEVFRPYGRTLNVKLTPAGMASYKAAMKPSARPGAPQTDSGSK